MMRTKAGPPNFAVILVLWSEMWQRKQILLNGGRWGINFCHHQVLTEILQNHAQLYPTLACIALNILLAQASSVPCERLFLGTKKIAVDCQLHLGPIIFEELAIMNLAWGPELYNMAAWNASQTEDIGYFDFEELLTKDVDCLTWDKELDLDGFEFEV